MKRRDVLKISAAGVSSLMLSRLSKAQKMHLKDCMDLASLDYFEVNPEGKLVLADGVADKIVDFHTHIGMTFLFSPKPDLDRKDDEVKTFFPLRGNPVDLTTYSAESFTEENHEINTKENLKQAYTKDGYNGTHTPLNLLDDMDRNKVTNSIILAIDLPLGAASRNTEHYLEASKKYPRLITFCSVHPRNAMMEKRVRQFKAQGAAGMKLHPSMQFIKPNHPLTMAVTKLCGELNLPVLFHSGSSPIQPKFQNKYPGIAHFWEPVEKQPETTFILAHGGIMEWKELIELAKRFENVHIELSGQPPEHIKQMLDAGLEDRMMFGSDWPFYIESLPLAKVLLATEGAPEVRHKLIYGNARRMLETMDLQQPIL